MSNKYLPRDLQKRLNLYVKKATFMERPHSSQRPLAEAFRACYLAMVELGMVKEEFINGEKEESKTTSS